MSKYTTEVRFICENKAGLDESIGFNSVDDVISRAWNKIFTSKVTFFDENYRGVLCSKILKHFYLREIGCETVGMWLLWMNTRLEEIMPYYNQLYESAKIKFDPMHDVDLTRSHKRNVNGTSTEDITRVNTSTNTKDTTTENTRNVTGKNDTKKDGSVSKTGSSSSDDNKWDLYSDTPQGGIKGLENENYLTNARKITEQINSNFDETDTSTDTTGVTYSETDTDKGTGKESGSETTNGTENSSGATTSAEDYLETLVGKHGTESFSSLLNKYRETFLNIDMQVINEFNDLFFNLW